jgi:hypothetical protein
MRAANEMSFVSIAIPAGFTNALTIGRNEYVANAGASSVKVYVILDDIIGWVILNNVASKLPNLTQF